MKYLAYPLSQALLRGVDRERLRRLFEETDLPSDLPVDALYARVQKKRAYLTNHLGSLLKFGGQRAEVVADAVYEVYEDWLVAGSAALPGGHTRSASILAGLFRKEDPFLCTITYSLYPRMPRRYQDNDLCIQFDSVWQPLVADRPRWCRPVGDVDPSTLDTGAVYPIRQPASFHDVRLPAREFWILVPDPENPDSGAYASWSDRPQLGVPFILLIQAKLLPQMRRLRDERLVEWKDEVSPYHNATWRELRDCMVVSDAWSGIVIEDAELHAALKPRASLNLGLSGGLRAPGLGGWMEGHGPRITVFGFHAEAEVNITRIGDEATVFSTTCKVNEPIEVRWPGVGDYRVEVETGGEPLERPVKILAWSDLRAADRPTREYVTFQDFRLCGGLIAEDRG